MGYDQNLLFLLKKTKNISIIIITWVINLLKSVLKLVHSCLIWIDKKIILPMTRQLVLLLSKRVAIKEYDVHPPGWKKKAMADFSSWIVSLPDNLSATQSATLDSCDLYTILAEFAGLRQEIKLQNREQNRNIQNLNSLAETFQNSSTLFAQQAQNLELFEKNIIKISEKKSLMPFLDIRDSLIRGYQASLEVMKSKYYFKFLPHNIEGIVEGYEIAIRKFDKALSALNVYPLETVGKPFDPKTMKAVDKIVSSELEQETVVEERISGFITQNNEILRIAEVVVSSKI